MNALSLVRREGAFFFGLVTALIFLTVGGSWFATLGGNNALAVVLFVWTFGAMLWGSFAVVRHADGLADLLGEPYGTLLLTISVISIEVVMIAMVMVTGDENPTLARDTMFAVVMIVLNGMVGLVLLVGGLAHGQPRFNLAGASTYLGVLIPLAVLTMVLPRFTRSAPGGEPSTLLAVFLVIASIVLYGVFLGVQTLRHQDFFRQPGADDDGHGGHAVRTVPYHGTMLVLTMIPIVLMSKSMAKLVDFGLTQVGAPAALGGFLVAILVLSPEAVAAVKAARADQLQRSINISFGSALATIGLTVPAVLMISLVTGKRIELGLDPVEIVVLAVTLATALVNVIGGRSNVLQGIVHLLLFAGYVVLIMD